MDLTGRTILVTGASSGIGRAASERLAGMGAELILVARDPGRLEAAARAVRGRSASGAVSAFSCDLSSLQEVRRLADAVRRRHPHLHVLVNNAGTFSPARELTTDGHERTFAVNHLAPYLLTRLLLDRLLVSAPSRVVTVSSGAHRHATIDFSDLGLARGYGILRAYARSKLANVLFTRELARRLARTDVTAYCFHPGTVATHIWSTFPWFARPFFTFARRFMRSPEEGAETLVHLASTPEEAGPTGAYLHEGKVVEPSPLALDEDLARRLWEESARLTGLEQ